MRILITGGSSYLGRHLVPLAAAGGHEICHTYFSQDALGDGRRLDLRDETAVQTLLRDYQPEAIIHTAGSNRSPDMTAVILQAAENLTRHGSTARLVHLSSDVVFDGRNGPYRETDPVSPRHAYGRAKADAEAIVAQHPNQVTVRTSLIYGLQIMDRSSEWISQALRAGEPVTLFTDQLRNPVWAESLSLACLELAQNEYRGILHVAGAQEMTRAEFGLKLLDWWGIQGRKSLRLGLSGPEWPLDCRMDVGLATAVLQTPLPGFDEVVDSHRE
jgi:dTDP-4-dehydrorhamnose reductase